MSEKIDWSKAPKWATHALEKLHEPDRNLVYWSFFVDGEHRVEPNGLWYHPDGYRIIQSRPSTPSWSGEGLPPVGVVCMAGCEQVVIVAHHCNGIHAIYAESESDGLLYYGEPNEFRPIRAPEQIAADKRKIEALKMFNIYCEKTNSSGANMDGFLALYDLGFRKP